MTSHLKFFAATVLLTGLLAIGAWKAAYSGQSRDIPLTTTGSDVPDAKVAGDVPRAMQQAQRLMTYLQQHHFPVEAPDELVMSPDQKFHEVPDMREAHTFRIIDPVYLPVYSQIAFECDLYARENVSHLRGNRATSSPNGFYIVGYRDGRVEQIPVGIIRLMPHPYHHGLLPCYPGMKQYREELPLMEGGNRKIEDKKFFAQAELANWEGKNRQQRTVEHMKRLSRYRDADLSHFRVTDGYEEALKKAKQQEEANAQKP